MTNKLALNLSCWTKQILFQWKLKSRVFEKINLDFAVKNRLLFSQNYKMNQKPKEKKHIVHSNLERTKQRTKN